MGSLDRTINGRLPVVPSNQRLELDNTDAEILRALQADGRMSTADLARTVHLSPSSTADRVRRLVDFGVISGYRAVVEPDAVGYPISAFVRLRYPSGNYRAFDEMLANTTEVVEAHHVTGDDCFILKVIARSMADLERIAGRIAGLGSITTSVVYSTPLAARDVSPA
jgi:Lrp/AsnC family transcriptional regulator, leucine-responsive regulatory protein